MCCGFFSNTASLQASVTNAEIQNITIDYLFQNKLSSASQYKDKTLFSYFTKVISGNQKPELKAAFAVSYTAIPEYWQAGRNWEHGDANN